KTVASVGFRGTGEFEILGPSSPSNTMSSLDLLYGKVLTDKKVTVSIHTGIGLVGSLERGEFLYADPGIFGPSHYEKVRSLTVGLPISTKVLLSISKHFGLGLEGYTNINSKNTFYGLNLYATFKNYKFNKKEKS